MMVVSSAARKTEAQRERTMTVVWSFVREASGLEALFVVGEAGAGLSGTG